jgi:hypothetical protein
MPPATRSLGWQLDLSQIDQDIHAALKTLQAKCDEFRKSKDTTVTAHENNCVSDKPGQIMYMTMSTDAVDELTASALITSRNNITNSLDFACSNPCLLRGKLDMPRQLP